MTAIPTLNKTLSIDFEYKNQQNYVADYVSVNIQTNDGLDESFWLYNNQDNDKILRKIKFILDSNSDRVFIAHSVLAESRSLLDLGIDPEKYNWFDTAIEFKMLMNYSSFLYDYHLFYSRKTGVQKIKKVVAPRYGQETPYNCTTAQPTNSLLTAKFSLLKNQDSVENVKEKHLYTDIILNSNVYTTSQQEGIMKYNKEDVTSLHAMATEILKRMKLLLSREDYSKYLDQAIKRANYQVAITDMFKRGYCIDKEVLDLVTSQQSKILFSEKRNFNSIYPELGIFELNKKGNRFTRKYKKIARYIDDNYGNKWPMTEKGQYSLAEETISEFVLTGEKYGNIPKEDFFGNFRKIITVEKTLRGFKRNAENTIYDYIGEDGRVRPYIPSFNGATGRTQYRSTSFLFLKSKWCRNLLRHDDYVHIACDYTSQEFLISGLLSGDREMINAYISGDVYVYFGSRYGLGRSKAKAVVLGISYGLTKYGLSKQLNCTLEEAQDYIDKFFDLFNVFKSYMDKVEKEQFFKKKYKQTKSGWTQFGQNPNFRSFFNFRIQGSGADLMRDAVLLCKKENLEIIFTLHDAIYIQVHKLNDWREAAKKLSECMVKAFVDYFDGADGADAIRTDIEAWHKDLPLCLAKDDKDNIFTKPSYVSEIDDKGNPCKVYEEYNRLIGGLSPVANI